jgi:hypothetical protein
MFPGVSVAPVSVTSAERMLTFEGGVSVMVSTTEEFPLFPTCEPSCEVPRQLASAAQKIRTEIGQIHRIRNMLPRVVDPPDSKAQTNLRTLPDRMS